MNRRAFFGLGTKVVGAVTLGAHIALDKAGVGASAEKRYQDTVNTVNPGSHVIVDWLASYETVNGVGNFTRSMPIQRGFYPPENTTWDGKPYARYWVSPTGYSVFYRREYDF